MLKKIVRFITFYTQSHNKEIIKVFLEPKLKCFYGQTKIHCGFPEQINLAEPNWRDGVFPELHLTIVV